MKRSYKLCEFCGKRVKSKYKHYQESLSCKLATEDQLREDESRLESWPGETTVECKICGYKAKELTRHLKTEHQITAKEYKGKYGQIISDYEKLKKSIFWRKRNAGENNPMYEKKPWNSDLSRKDEITEKLGSSWRGKSFSRVHKEKLASAKSGITGEDANAYGPHNVSEEGRRKMRGGSEKALLEFRKSRSSKFEKELFVYLQNIFPNVKTQHKLGYNLVDFYIPERNLVIEADGIYWHAIIHGAVTESKANYQQKHTYRYDKSKTTYLTNRGYTIIRVREDHYKEHKKKGVVLKWLRALLK